MTMAVALLVSTAQAQTLVLKWRNSGVGNAGNRGMAYNPVTGNLLLVQSGQILRYKSSDSSSGGANLNTADINTGGLLRLCGVAADADGAVYATSYNYGASTIYLYKWDSEDATSQTTLWSGTYGTGTERIGAILTVTGTGNDAKFIVAGNGTSAAYIYYDGSAWTAKTLTCNNQAMTSGAVFVDYNNGGSGKWRILAKTGQTSGFLFSFDPTAGSPIALTVDKNYTSGPLGFYANGIHDIAYDPTTGVIGACTRVTTASPFSYTNYVLSTLSPNSITSPAQTGKNQPPNASAGDSGSVGGAAWGTNLTLYTSASAAGAGLNAYYIAPFKITDITPASQIKNLGNNATFSVAAGGTLPLTYTWKQGTTVLSDDDNHSGTTTATLTIYSVGLGDLGTYTCTVSNVTGLSQVWTSSGGILGLASATVVNSSAASTTYGDSVTFTATVSGGAAGTPTGNVTFKDVTTSLGAQPLDGSGEAALTTSALGATNSPHSITAVYGGNTSYVSSTSTVSTVTVNKKTLTASVTVGNKVYNGDTTATITGRSLLGVVSGDEAAVTLGTSGTTAFPSPDVGSYNLTISGLAISGTRAGNYVLSTDPVTAPADITPAASTTGLISSQNPSTNGVSVSFTATVSSSAGTPTGNVVFLTNNVPMATVPLISGSASASTADLPVGTQTIKAQYAAQANWLGSSQSLDQVVYSAAIYSTTNAVLSLVNNGDDTFTLNCKGTPGAQYYVVEASSLTGSWTPLANSTNAAPDPDGLWSFVVSNAAPAFYRSAAVNPAP